MSRIVVLGLVAVGVAATCAWAGHTIKSQAETIGDQRQQLADMHANFAELEQAMVVAEQARQVEVTALKTALAAYRAESVRAKQHANELQNTLATERGRNEAFDTCMDLPVPDAVLERLRY